MNNLVRDVLFIQKINEQHLVASFLERSREAQKKPGYQVYPDLHMDACDICIRVRLSKEETTKALKEIYELRENDTARLLTIKCCQRAEPHDRGIALYKEHGAGEAKVILTPSQNRLQAFGPVIPQATKSPMEPLVLFFESPYPRIKPGLHFCNKCKRDPYYNMRDFKIVKVEKLRAIHMNRVYYFCAGCSNIIRVVGIQKVSMAEKKEITGKET